MLVAVGNQHNLQNTNDALNHEPTQPGSGLALYIGYLFTPAHVLLH